MRTLPWSVDQIVDLLLVLLLGSLNALLHHVDGDVTLAADRILSSLVEEADERVEYIQLNNHLILALWVFVEAIWFVDGVHLVAGERVHKESLKENERLELDKDLQSVDVHIV